MLCIDVLKGIKKGNLQREQEKKKKHNNITM